MLGLGSIMGTGVFVSIGVAAGVAGPSVILAILLAALLAACNALSSAQLAAAYPVSGGTYEYGYRLLRPEFGFTAGWMFLCAKTASAATAAIGAAGYAFNLLGRDPQGLLGVSGSAATLVFTLLVLSGLRRSDLINRVIVSVTLLALGAFIIAGLSRVAEADSGRFTPFFPDGGDVSPLLYATALMFVAFAGYARVATLGEEVRSPEKTIPRAIIIMLVVTAIVYVLVAVAAIGAVGVQTLADSTASAASPLEVAARAMELPGLPVLVALGAVTAMLGVLLNLILGLSRVGLAMGRRSDIPPVFARIVGGSPRPAIIAVGLATAALALTGDVETTWAFSAFTVLVYYGITNLAALRLPHDLRRYPRVIAWAGLIGCLALIAFIPPRILLPGVALIAAGLIWRLLARRLWPQPGVRSDRKGQKT
jgi:APA family basic amino acid/polyamine antiporter